MNTTKTAQEYSQLLIDSAAHCSDPEQFELIESLVKGDNEFAGRLIRTIHRLEGATDQELKALLNADELAAFNRCVDCFDDGEGYDVPKPMMSRLAQIGVLRHVGKGVYETTEFGMHIRLSDIAEPVGVPTVQAGEPIAYYFEYEDEDGTQRMYNGHNQFPGGSKGKPLYAAPSQPVADHTEQHLAMVPSTPAAGKSEAECYSHNDGDSWCDCPDDILFVMA